VTNEPETASVLVVFTDGACSGNPGPGGWGWSTETGIEGSGSERQSTNQRMEVWAVLDALQTLLPRHAGPIQVVSDSTYVVNCFRDRWWQGWMSRGWKNSQKQPVANQDLWKPLVELYRDAMTMGNDRIAFRWVKGHSGNAMNDRVDELAVAAAKTQSVRTITGLEKLSAESYVHELTPSSVQPTDIELVAGPAAEQEALRLF
jgi:ribonuclease HI